jgi:ComF family protein
MAEKLRIFAEDLGLDAADVVIPVPIHWSRRFHRGFNQSELLCEAMESTIVKPKALRRIRATRPQVGLTPEERRHNLQNAFACQADVSGKKVLLVDDVITTGHTVGECAKTLKNAGALEVTAIAFAGS